MSKHEPWKTGEGMAKGLKADQGKLSWYALPLEILEPLAELMRAGEQKYGTFNCLEPFDEPDRRFWDANMRHAAACQCDPLARDEETGCYHEAARAFSSLMRIYHCKRQAIEERRGCENEEPDPESIVQSLYCRPPGPGFCADPEEL